MATVEAANCSSLRASKMSRPATPEVNRAPMKDSTASAANTPINAAAMSAAVSRPRSIPWGTQVVPLL